MSQYDFGTINTSTTTGGDLATLLQNWRDAVLSNHVGDTRPSYVKEGQLWIDNTTATDWIINLYDGATDIPLGYVNPTDNTAGLLFKANITLKSASASIVMTERNMIVGVNAAGGNITLTMPLATTAKNGFQITFQKRDSSANTVTITRSGSDLINGAASVILTQQYDTAQLVCDGATLWYAFGGVLDSAITSAKIANNAVTTAKILDGAVTAAKLAASVSDLLIPPGSMVSFGGIAAPAGWLLCYGQAISRTTYAALYAALGGASSPHGQGDGSTTFNIPDARGRVLAGFDGMGGVSANRLKSTRTVAIATISQSSTTVTVNTSVAHGLTAGESVTISGAGNALFNGVWTVLEVITYSTEGERASQRFTFTRTSASISSVSGGTITTTIAGSVDGSVVGATGGASTHVLKKGELAAHGHYIYNNPQSPESGGGDAAVWAIDPGAGSFAGVTNTEGGDGPHNNVQPTLVTNVIIKT